ncbi:MAG: hypothetical protein JAY74_03670 [Candidatus Thiodiazotropha taylori]|nr:hypothetical protein [Candidatus Thiodiazotropha taylori]
MNAKLVVVLLLISNIAHSADIFIDKDMFGFDEIKVEGAIKQGDLEKIKIISTTLIDGVSRNTARFNVNINSEGGDVVEAIEIGRFLRNSLASISVYGSLIRPRTHQTSKDDLQRLPNLKYINQYDIDKNIHDALVESDIRKCYSSCILIFYGAVERSLRDNADQRDGSITDNNLIPVMGLHRPYYEKHYFSKLNPIEAKQKYKELQKLVKDYLIEMGAPDELTERMLRSSSNDIELVRKEEFEKYYSKISPFYEEWLIAKCGSEDDVQTFLNGDDLSDWIKYDNEVMEYTRNFIYTNRTPPDLNEAIYKSSISRQRVDYLRKIVGEQRSKVLKCKTGARLRHQLEYIFATSE